ncbi:MAG: hypothetical protein IKS05_10650, partial [Oscillospiraceae bacterium]|nr:hypothetical protein [Oscillospiraceae bacterium]
MPDNQPFQILLDPKSNQAENHAQFRRPSSGAGPNSPKSCLREGDAPASIAPLPLTVLPASIHSTEAKTPDTETRLSALPSRAPGPAPEPQPEPRAEEQKSSRSGRKAFLVIALVAALALGTFLIDRFVMPKVHYQEAMRLMAEGKYDRALAIFAAMEDYQDSKDRIVQCKDGKARTLMCEGKYQQALDLLEAEIGDSPLIADCLYALGVTAYNERDPQTALQYTRQLRTRFPDYEKTEELEQF